MIPIIKQIKLGYIVCPITKQRLSFSDGELVSEDKSYKYTLVDGIPVLLKDKELKIAYFHRSDCVGVKSSSINKVYADLIYYISRMMRRTYPCQNATLAFEKVISNKDENALCLSIGGGPGKPHPNLTNVNLFYTNNVDVVGNAYQLPYADNVVDSIYCGAVLEHLEFPADAVQEMYRVLKAGGEVYAVTPFLQELHGSPSHYQNYTLMGHERLFANHGFLIKESGTHVGPVYMLTNLIGVFLLTYLPFPLNKIIKSIWRVISVFINPLDLFLCKSKDSDTLASTTYVVAIKK
jgi:uncharacterized protein YbaR (Trm112 family)/SAM-dependent methyltransferase